MKLDEVELPVLDKNEEVDVKKINLLDKETKPPKRYTPASIIKELEKRNLGTKSTRANIIETLFDRGYIYGTPMEATELGIKTIDTLHDHAPMIIDEELTSSFEKQMEEIREKKKNQEEVLNDAKKILTKTLDKFKKDEHEIGEKLIGAIRESEDKKNTIGKCHKCNEGTLMIRKGKFGNFIACDKYPDCKTTFPLPKTGLIKATDELCEECEYPKILIIKKRKKPQSLCINPDCPSKQVDVKTDKDGKIDRKCPKCSKDLILRKSTYGAFIACTGYPKCKYTESLENSS